MPDAPRWTEYLPLPDIAGAHRNPKGHDEPGIAASLDHFGYVEAITLDERTGRLVAGHGRLKSLVTAQADGGAPPDGIVVDDDGTWLVPVQRGWQSRDDAHAEAYLVASNRLTERGGWLPELGDVLTDLRDAGQPLEAIGYSDRELDDLLNNLTPGPGSGGPSGDGGTWTPPAKVDPITQPGATWHLGPHRLWCGDSTDLDALDRLLDSTKPAALYADPPYGMNLDTDYPVMHHTPEGPPTKSYRRVEGDDQPFDPTPWIEHWAHVAEQWWWGADYYRDRLPQGGSWLVWDKRATAAGDGVAEAAHGSMFELAWSRQPHRRMILRVLWAGIYGMGGTVAADRTRVHPTQKPTMLHRLILDQWVAPDGLVLDPFAGSGSTLIAADLAGRRAALAELDPGYCDVICHRYQEHTGIMPKLEGTEEVDFSDVDPLAVAAGVDPE